MADATSPAPTYVVYWLYRLDPAFRALSHEDQVRAKQEFLDTLEGPDASVTLRGTYSFAGLRADADLMLWVLGKDLDTIQRLAVALRRSAIGRYLRQVQTYVGVTTAARYDPEHQPAILSGAAPKAYVSVYPFVKTHEWYLLPFEERRSLMAEHGRVGRRYAVSRERLKAAISEQAGPGATATATKAASAVEVAEDEGGGVLSSTVDAFGLGDYEFILANESDDPAELCKMMMSLRATEVRRYTALDTPIYLGRLRAPAQVLDDI